MDPAEKTGSSPGPAKGRVAGGVSRRAVVAGAAGLGGLVAAGLWRGAFSEFLSTHEESQVFKGGAPSRDVFDAFVRRGWAREGLHALTLGKNVQCKLCPNNCLLEPGDRSHCRNRINVDGRLYTLAYANPCTFHVDPVEKKPLLHFLPGSSAFSLAVSGCGYRCLNCQNWEISQKTPEETKEPSGPPLELNLSGLSELKRSDLKRLSLFPEEVVEIAAAMECASIAYTYSEPTVWYEYMLDICRVARARGIKNVWVTCGAITQEALAEIGPYFDAANVDLKSFRDETYQTLNTGRLQPVLETLQHLHSLSVWLEITNLVVPTYTDDLEMIARMCDWILAHLGPDYPLHFSRFRPEHKLTHLPPTSTQVLVAARDVARKAGLHHVYIGNVREVADADTTQCPQCRRTVLERDVFTVKASYLEGDKCSFCGARISGVWSL